MLNCGEVEAGEDLPLMKNNMAIIGSQVQPRSSPIVSSGYEPRLLRNHIEQETTQIYSAGQGLGVEVKWHTAGKRDIDIALHRLQAIRTRTGKFAVKEDVTVYYIG